MTDKEALEICRAGIKGFDNMSQMIQDRVIAYCKEVGAEKAKSMIPPLGAKKIAKPKPVEAPKEEAKAEKPAKDSDKE